MTESHRKRGNSQNETQNIDINTLNYEENKLNDYK